MLISGVCFLMIPAKITQKRIYKNSLIMQMVPKCVVITLHSLRSPLCMCVCVSVCIYSCECACECVRERAFARSWRILSFLVFMVALKSNASDLKIQQTGNKVTIMSNLTMRDSMVHFFFLLFFYFFLHRRLLNNFIFIFFPFNKSLVSLGYFSMAYFKCNKIKSK